MRCAPSTTPATDWHWKNDTVQYTSGPWDTDQTPANFKRTLRDFDKQSWQLYLTWFRHRLCKVSGPETMNCEMEMEIGVWVFCHTFRSFRHPKPKHACNCTHDFRLKTLCIDSNFRMWVVYMLLCMDVYFYLQLTYKNECNRNNTPVMKCEWVRLSVGNLLLPVVLR